MDYILHIGAGVAEEFSDWLDLGAQQIVLVEPNPILAEQLRQKTSGEPRVKVLETAITTDPANNQLFEYNLLQASSLHPAKGLKVLFPGLKTCTTHTVATLSPEQLIAEEGPEPGQLATLVLQAPGEEHAIIQALINTNQLKRFCNLRLDANPEPYYQGSIAAEQTLHLLADYGYDVTDEDRQYPDWPSWKLARDSQKDTIADLQKEIDKFEEQLQEKNKKLQEVAKENEEHKIQLDKCQKQSVEREEFITSFEIALKQVEEERDEEKKQYATREKKLVVEVEALKKNARQWESAREELVKENNIHKQTIGALEGTKQQAEKFQKELEKEQQAHIKTAKSLEDYKGWLNNRKSQLEKLTEKSQQATVEIENLKIQIMEFDSLKEKVKKTERRSTERQEQLAELAEKNRKLIYDNKKMSEKMSSLEKELIKAEAQVSIIKTLLLEQ